MLDGRSSNSISGLMGYVSFFENFIQIAVLLFAWIVVLLAFFILAIQLFITLIEFKLTTLAGFVLIPFGLFGKTAFAAERVLGNVISSGVKVLVLAVIVGIGSTLFCAVHGGLWWQSADHRSTPWRWCWERFAFSASASSGLALPTASYPADRNLAPAPRSAPASPRVAPSWLAPVSQPVVPDSQAAHSWAAPVARPRSQAERQVPTAPEDWVASRAQGARRSSARCAAWLPGSAGGSPAADAPPAWARRMKRAQTVNQGVSAATHAVRSGDGAGGGSSVDLSEGGH